MRIRGIVFDMDGVLLLSSGIHEEAFRQALTEFPIQPIDYGAIAGMRTDEAIRFVLSNNGITATEQKIANLSARKSHLARTMVAERKPVAPECLKLISALADAYSLALASSASAPSVDLFLAMTGLRNCFRAILSGADVKHAKPAPDIYTLACARLELTPQNCLIIEDAVSGVTAGKAAGAQVWGLAGTSQAAALTAAGADRVVTSLEALYELTGAKCH